MITKFLVVLLVAHYCEAYYYYSEPLSASPIPAAIASTRKVELTPVSLPQDPILPQVLEVAALELPIQIIFNSRSSPVLVHQNHIPGAPGQVEKTTSQEEPLIVINEVTRPVIQELREVITPYRRVVQEVSPVVETVNTIISKGEQPVSAVQVAPVAAPKPSATPVAALAVPDTPIAPVVPLVPVVAATPVYPVASVVEAVKAEAAVAASETIPVRLMLDREGYKSLLEFMATLRGKYNVRAVNV